jgi:hypothetical protein
MNPEKKRPVTLEDLLRLKRCERPEPGFWADFDRQLRAKQLAALVERRPWWQELSLARVFAGVKRYHLPLGAAAVVALTFVSVRVGYSPVTTVEPGHAPGQTPVMAEPQGEASRLESPAPVAREVAAESALGTTRGAAMVESSVAREDLVVASAAEAARLVPLLGVPPDAGIEAGSAGSGLHVETGVGATPTSEVVLASTLLGGANGFSRLEARTTSARPAIEPLRQITPPAERRGSRILTAMVSMASVENAMRSTERAASRLSEEQLYEQIQRFGARGAGVNVKF